MDEAATAEFDQLYFNVKTAFCVAPDTKSLVDINFLRALAVTAAAVCVTGILKSVGLHTPRSDVLRPCM